MNAVWVDEFRSESAVIPLQQPNQYWLAHKTFVEKRVKKLQLQIVKRKATVISCQPQATKETSWQSYVAAMKQAVLQLHGAHHVVDEKTGKEVSFGLMRFANIDPCVNMALSLLSAEWPDDTAVFIMCYHSRQVCCCAMNRKHISIVSCAASKRREIGLRFKIAFFVLIWMEVKSIGVFF